MMTNGGYYKSEFIYAEKLSLRKMWFVCKMRTTDKSILLLERGQCQVTPNIGACAIVSIGCV